jgi:maleamate amidohydrolase
MTITTPPSPVSDAEFFRERGFGLPIGFGARPVLLVVDLTKGFTDAKRPLGADLTGQIRGDQCLAGGRAPQRHPGDFYQCAL